MNLKILIVQKRFHPNSIGIVKSLQRRGHKVAMMVHSHGSDDQFSYILQPLVVPYYRSLKKLLIRYGPKAVHRYAIPNIRALVSVFKDFKPDLVIIKKTRVPSLIASVVARIFGAKRLIVQDHPVPQNDYLLNRVLMFCGIIPITIVSTTMQEAGALGKKFSEKRLFLPYPVELPTVEKRVVRVNNMLKVLFVGKWSLLRKRPWWLLDALEEAELEKKVKLTFVGSGNQYSPGAVKILERVDKLGCAVNFTMLYNIPHDKMNAIYAEHDIFVLPAKDEPFGVVVLEAMANGLPVICSDTVGTKSCIFNGENGLIFKTDSLSDLSRCLRFFYDNPAQVDLMGKAARDTVAEYCSLDAWGASIETLIY